MICGVLFCFVFFLKQRQHYLGSLSCVEVPGWVLCWPRFSRRFPEGSMLQQKMSSSTSRSPEDGEEGSVLAAPWRCLASLLSGTQLATFSAEPRGWSYCLPALGTRGKCEPASASAGCLPCPAVVSGPHASVCPPGQGRGRCLPSPPFLISTLGPCRVGSCAWLSPLPPPLPSPERPSPPPPPFQLPELISAREISHFCSQTLLGSNWNQSKTDRQSGQL